jgi:AcrR family transcriptional regulator
MSASRPYKLSRRAQGVLETRHRIVDAAIALFRESSYHRVSVDEVAARAGVGRTTVFQQFESKSGLLRAVEQEVSARAGVDELLQKLADPDALAALHAAFDFGCHVWARERLMFRKLFSFAVVDEEMHEVMTTKDAGRRALVEDLVRRLHKQKHLAPGMSAKKAGDLLWLLTSFESFETLYERTSDASAVAKLLTELVSVILKR